MSQNPSSPSVPPQGWDDGWNDESTNPGGAPRFTTRETLRGMSDSVSAASAVFSNQVRTARSWSDLPDKTISGVLQANAAFLTGLADLVGSLDWCGWDTADRVARPVIDYEHLADLVAERLRRPEPPATPGDGS